MDTLGRRMMGFLASVSLTEAATGRDNRHPATCGHSTWHLSALLCPSQYCLIQARFLGSRIWLLQSSWGGGGTWVVFEPAFEPAAEPLFGIGTGTPTRSITNLTGFFTRPSTSSR